MTDNQIEEPPAHITRIARQNFGLDSNIENYQKLTCYNNVFEMVEELQPNSPVHCIRPHVLSIAAKYFLKNFPGKALYSVKSNPDKAVLECLYKSGITHYDVASLNEVRLINNLLPNAKMYFMHPVKSREAIREAYFDYNIKDFSLDSSEELQKIIEITEGARDLNLHIRLQVANSYATHDLSTKFGATENKATELLQLARKITHKLGICFHVGSQCMNPKAYKDAITYAEKVVKATNVSIDVLDVGGGFPSIYPNLLPLDLDHYIEEIKNTAYNSKLLSKAEMWCEPGRALVAEAGSTVTRVELRKGNALYLNDGIYGSLYDAGIPKMQFPTRLIPASGESFAEKLPFVLYGPTCDSLDTMHGPFYIPANVTEGDWLEIGQLGSYGSTFRTKFNGFYSDTLVEVNDNPIISMYGLKNTENGTHKRIGKQPE